MNEAIAARQKRECAMKIRRASRRERKQRQRQRMRPEPLPNVWLICPV